jgi:hypothetical protein
VSDARCRVLERVRINIPLPSSGPLLSLNLSLGSGIHTAFRLVRMTWQTVSEEAQDFSLRVASETRLGMTLLGLMFSSMYVSRAPSTLFPSQSRLPRYSLYGISVSQTFTYFRRFPRDRTLIKGLVGPPSSISSYVH